MGRGFPGGEVLRESGIGAVIVLALLSRGERLGTLVVADGGVLKPHSDTVELLELLVSQTASGLRTVLATEAVRDSERRFRTLAEHSSDVICLHHPNGTLAYVSPSATTVLGRRPGDLIGTDLFEPCHAEEKDGLKREVQAALRHGGVVVYRCTIGSGEDRWFETTITPVRDGSYGAQSSTRDVTERRRTEHRLAHQALHDALTGLPNRVHLMKRLEEVLAGGKELALLFTDLDGFKAVNDRFGHTAGDEMLRAVARRMSGGARPSDMIARLGGDEFVMLCLDVTDPMAAQVIADRLAWRLAEPFSLSVGKAMIRASIGIAIGNAASHTAAELLADADAAMYRAKRRDLSRSPLP
jgi:diguanylate cyclase (GGDEF)-like protein/PAS domain S-box-containing protein